MKKKENMEAKKRCMYDMGTRRLKDDRPGYGGLIYMKAKRQNIGEWRASIGG